MGPVLFTIVGPSVFRGLALVSPILLSGISICIAIAAFTVALRNFRLSRFPHVRLVFDIHYGASIENPKGDHFFFVEVESWGLPIYDTKVVLEADYRLGFHPEIGRYSVELSPVGTRPNPMNAGQVAIERHFNNVAKSLNRADCGA
jgi:hypothetical protein